MYEFIEYTKEDHIATIRLNRPEKMNALHPDMMVEMMQALEDVEKDDDIHVIVITGSTGSHGPSFCAGDDLTYMAYLREDPKRLEAHYKKYGMELNNMLITLWNGLEFNRKPVIAAVDGWALAGGCEMMVACDIIIASERAKMGFPEVFLGGFPGSGGPIRTARMVLGGAHKAKELCWLGDPIDANEALRIGLVNKVVPADKLEEEVQEFAKKIASRQPRGVQGVKYIINKSMELSIPAAMEFLTTYERKGTRREIGFSEELTEAVQAYRARFAKKKMEKVPV